MKIKRSTLFIAAGLLLGFGSGFAVSRVMNRPSNPAAKYPLLAKRLHVDNPNEPIINFTTLRKELERYVDGKGAGSHNISVYFEYLPTGISININENNVSIAASLMKVPVIMTLYQLADSGKINLDKEVALKQEWLNDEYGTLYQKGAGYHLTIREAVELTLRDSDNTALQLIFDQLGGIINEDQNVLNFLDLEYDKSEDKRVQISARSYSSILKCLYFACFNSLDSSQEILAYLTESSHGGRLTANLPKNIKVAHKIGTFSEEYQSDCGIFYVTKGNYILCVMIKGQDPAASENIADISEMVYNYIQQLFIKDRD